MTKVTNSIAGLTKERIDQARKSGPSKDALEMKEWLNKFHDIEEKSKCLRVQFLDWLSDKLLDWSNKCHEMSVHIDSPCVIKVEPRKKEESNDAKERKEIAKLKENLARLQTQNEKLREGTYRIRDQETAGDIAAALGDVKR